MTTKRSKHIPALKFFHVPPHKWNCAQAIFKAYQYHDGLSDEEIETNYRSKGGGRADGNLCGALYAAIEILGRDSREAAELKAEFDAKLGAMTCKSLKIDLKVPCPTTVLLADELLEVYLERQRERLKNLPS